MFSTPSDIRDVSVAIRDAVAPVFLLTGLGSILSVLVNRLGRTIDRARYLNSLSTEQRKIFLDELDIVIKRIRWIRWSIGLFTFTGLCVALVIASIFIGVAIKINLADFVLVAFISAMFSLILGLLSFLREIILASHNIIIRPQQD